MVNQEIRATNVKVPQGNLEIDAYLAIPLDPGTYPGIVVVQEVFGVNAHIREVTERIAKEGYVAIAPAIYQRVAPGFEVGYTSEDLEVGRKYKQRSTTSKICPKLKKMLLGVLVFALAVTLLTLLPL